MSRRKADKEDEPEGRGPLGKGAAILLILIIIGAGIGMAVFFMANPAPLAGVNYGEEGKSGDSVKDPVAVLYVRSDDNTIDGIVKIELYRKEAPITVDNFIRYAKAGLYNGTLIHRVEKDFVVQGGGYYPNGTHIPTYPPIVSEANNGLSNKMWTVAMALSSNPDGSTNVNSATSQFFINMNDNTQLDTMGFTVFGKVIDGFDVLDEINQVDTTAINSQFHVPNTNIVVVSVTIQGA